MLKLAGQVVDVHDDPTLKRLVDALPIETLREKFGSTTILDQGEMVSIPDTRLGAIFFDSNVIGGWEKRAYLLTAPDHAELSLLYFTKAAEEGIFPPSVRNQIACQIKHGLEMWDIEVPEAVEKWAEEYGDWIPNDNFIDLATVQDEGEPATTTYAFAKVAGENKISVLPCGTPEDTAASIRAILDEDAGEMLGLDRFEIVKAASALKFAAERQGIRAPKALIKMACVDERDPTDVAILLTERLRLVPEDAPTARVKLAHDTVHSILKEASITKKAALLSAFDKTFGIGERAYGAGVPRPFDVFFEPAQVKTASNEDLIAQMGGIERITTVVGEKRAKAFEKNASEALAALKPEVRAVLLHGVR